MISEALIPLRSVSKAVPAVFLPGAEHYIPCPSCMRANHDLHLEQISRDLSREQEPCRMQSGVWHRQDVDQNSLFLDLVNEISGRG